MMTDSDLATAVLWETPDPIPDGVLLEVERRGLAALLPPARRVTRLIARIAHAELWLSRPDLAPEGIKPDELHRDIATVTAALPSAIDALTPAARTWVLVQHEALRPHAQRVRDALRVQARCGTP